MPALQPHPWFRRVAISVGAILLLAVFSSLILHAFGHSLGGLTSADRLALAIAGGVLLRLARNSR